jgi:hypothetical protein
VRALLKKDKFGFDRIGCKVSLYTMNLPSHFGERRTNPLTNIQPFFHIGGNLSLNCLSEAFIYILGNLLQLITLINKKM